MITSNCFSVKDKNIIITGASKGIGLGVASVLTEYGATVIMVARESDDLRKGCKEINKNFPGKAHAYAADLRNVDDIRVCVNKIASDLGKIDVLFNNAGMGHPISALEVKESDWDEMIDLNLKGMFFFAQEVAKKMATTGGGKIVNMSSQASVVAIEDESIYCTSKGGVNQLTKSLALEFAKHNINVNAIGPTFVYTPGTADRLDNPEIHNKIIQKIPLKKLCTINDIANLVMFLSSAASDMITGELILIDGGWTII